MYLTRCFFLYIILYAFMYIIMITATFANITEIRTKMTSLTKQVLEDGFVILLKNGKPLLALLDYRDMEEYQQWKEEKTLRKKHEEWKASLPTRAATKEEERAIEEAEKSDSITMTVAEACDYVESV